MFYTVIINTLTDMILYPSTYNLCTGIIVGICIILFLIINIRLLRNMYHWFTSTDKILQFLKAIDKNLKEVNDTLSNTGTPHLTTS